MQANHDYLSALVAACVEAQDNGTRMADPVTDAMFHAAEYTEVRIEATRDAMKAKGIDGSLISKLVGKRGVVTLARVNPDATRKWLAEDGAGLTSLQTIYTRFGAFIKAANSVAIESVDDAEAAILAKQATEAEARAKSITKSLGVISAQQALGAILAHASGVSDVSKRREWLAVLANGIADAVDALDAEVTRIEKEAQPA